MGVGIDPRILAAWRGLLPCWDIWAFTFLLGVIVPALSYVKFRRWAARAGQPPPPRMKLAIYGRTVGAQWLLVVAMLLVLWRHGLSAADAGERLGDPRLTLGVTSALLIILAAASTVVLTRVRRAKPATPKTTVDRLQKLAPGSRVEMAAFVILCLTAGFCEEILYRGWLVTILLVATGSPWIAIIAGATVFGVGHAYQGVTAVLRAAFVGLQLAALYIMVGSLIPGQILHAGVDLLIGVAGALAASKRSAAST
jgi:uncharacterized protein